MRRVGERLGLCYSTGEDQELGQRGIVASTHAGRLLGRDAAGAGLRLLQRREEAGPRCLVWSQGEGSSDRNKASSLDYICGTNRSIGQRD